MKVFDTSRLFASIDDSGEILIVTHFHPDGDAVGSTTALLDFLHDIMGKKADIVFSSAIPDTLLFMSSRKFPDAELSIESAAASIASADLIICLDCSSLGRTGSLYGLLKESQAQKILIDHHLTPATEEFDLVYSDTDVSSTCELLYYILLQHPAIGGDAARLPEGARDSLMTGMTTDTNNFANSVFPGTLQMASSLLSAGVDRGSILEHLYHCHKESRLRLLGYLLEEGMTITPEGVALMSIDKPLAERFGINEGDTEGFVNEPLAIGRVRMSILIKEYDDSFRVSVRSKKGVSANALCRDYFHGGGHEQAAGGKLYVPQDISSKEDILPYIESVTARFMQSQAPSERI